MSPTFAHERTTLRFERQECVQSRRFGAVLRNYAGARDFRSLAG